MSSKELLIITAGTALIISLMMSVHTAQVDAKPKISDQLPPCPIGNPQPTPCPPYPVNSTGVEASNSHLPSLKPGSQVKGITTGQAK